MAEKKTPKRTFESELRSLPLELVPPDPRRLNQAGELEVLPFGLEPERKVVDKLIDRIKRL